MKDFHCRDAGLDCDWAARGDSNEEILKQVGTHAQQAHKMTATPELIQKVTGLIHDEQSDAHRKSSARP